jgi:hypothetical protein
MTPGVFTLSKIKDPTIATIRRDHGHARRTLSPTTKHLIFADGTGNPWGMVLIAPVIFRQRLRGRSPLPWRRADFVRQGGLRRIMRMSFLPCCRSGITWLPAEPRFIRAISGGISRHDLIGNIHDNAIHQDRLTPNGSSFKASFIRDFVRANDGWFMPVSTQVGPDGCVWLMDWYDRYPCYQNANADPSGVDREYGRIWRVVYVGNIPGAIVQSRPEVGMDLSRLNTTELVKTLEHPFGSVARPSGY